MKTAELLYNKGFISYPRTETNSFKPFTNFKKLIEFQRDHETLSKYANSLLSNRIYPPREGPKNDNSHPPIYPAKALNRNALDLDNVNLITPEEIELYELNFCFERLSIEFLFKLIRELLGSTSDM